MTRHVSLAPPPNNIPDKNHYSWANWFMTVFERTGAGPFKIQGYPYTNLPDPAENARTTGDDPFSSLIFVPDGPNGASIAFSTGSAWLRVDGGVL